TPERSLGVVQLAPVTERLGLDLVSLADDPLREQAFRSHARVGMATCSAVPPPDGLAICMCPPRASTRSIKPTSPDPLLLSAPPMPSSRIETTRSDPLTRASISIEEACACRVAFVM